MRPPLTMESMMIIFKQDRPDGKNVSPQSPPGKAETRERVFLPNLPDIWVRFQNVGGVNRAGSEDEKSEVPGCHNAYKRTDEVTAG